MIENSDIPESPSQQQLIAEIAEHYRSILRLIGEDPDREGLVKTPCRAAKALLDVTNGYQQDADKILKSAIFDYAGSKIVVVKDIEFYSLCEHHILPFFGTISIGYIPVGHIVGLSKLARVINVFSHRLQVQERLTRQICDSITESLDTRGVIVICKAGHLCMKMRGVEKQDCSTATMEYSGDFNDANLREEFFRLIG
ncbi:MAG: GTP cyclohydrolase I FolE [Muribaculaceae bacterium]|jgi:GTP cyclohydrolase I|nr:GTP cyclohydrolase I FolE [Muribaculaceae bacterium]